MLLNGWFSKVATPATTTTHLAKNVGNVDTNAEDFGGKSEYETF